MRRKEKGKKNEEKEGKMKGKKRERVKRRR